MCEPQSFMNSSGESVGPMAQFFRVPHSRLLVAVDDARLTLPHPRAHEREFVLRPLADIAPDLPIGGATPAQLLAALTPQGVRPADLSLMPDSEAADTDGG